MRQAGLTRNVTSISPEGRVPRLHFQSTICTGTRGTRPCDVCREFRFLETSRFDFISPAANLKPGYFVKIFLGLVLGIVIGAAGFWYLNTADGKSRVQGTSEQVHNAAKSTGDAIHEKLKVLVLRPEDIKEDLARSGQVVRRQARDAGKAIADATADARTTTAIKAKLLGDRNLSALSISVNTTAGVVTLSGTAPSAEAISHAMLLAMETDGVREVISTVQVRPPTKQG